MVGQRMDGAFAGGRDVSRVTASQVLAGRVLVGLLAWGSAVLPNLSQARTPDVLQASNPGVFVIDGAKITGSSQSISVRTPLQVRFATSAARTDLCKAQLTVVGPNGQEGMRFECTPDSVRLHPVHDLLPAARYTLFVKQEGSDDLQATYFETLAIPAAKIALNSLRGNEEWRPRSDHKDAWHYAWGSRPQIPGTPDLSAAAGRTAVAGRLLRFNGEALEGVRVYLGSSSTRTDVHGRFLLQDVPAGAQVLGVDGTQVVIDKGHYTKHYVHVELQANQTTRVARPIYLARVDPGTEVSIASPTERDVVLTHPAMPGLEVRIPKGVVIRDQDGSLVTKVSLTPVPLDRAPYATPIGFPIYFTLQPGGAFVDAHSGESIQISYPNYGRFAAGASIDFWNYDPTSGWKVYGQGKVSSDRQTIVADASSTKGLALQEIMTFGYAASTTVPPKGPVPGGVKGGDPVDLATGIYVAERTDLSIADVTPIAVSRSYNALDQTAHAFGAGWNLTYQMTLYQPNLSEIDLVLADNTRIPFMLQSDGTTFRSTTAPVGAYYGATLTQIVNPNYVHDKQFEITLRDQTRLHFDGHGLNPLLEVIDRNGNTVKLARDELGTGKITQITSPNGRFITLTYNANGLITQATDNIGRVVNYAYDTSNIPRLLSVTDADQTDLPSAQQANVIYSYDSSGRLAAIKDKRGNVAVTNNQYDSQGRMLKQTLADGTTWLYEYGYDYVYNWVKTTNPRGYVTQYFFNAQGYVTKQIAGVNATAPFVPQTSLIFRDSNGQVITVQDPLGRQTNLEYDGWGNVNKVTRLANSSKAVSVKATFDANFNQPLVLTNEIGATASLSYDSYGNLTSIVDPLGKTWRFTPNDQGLTQQSTTPLGNSTILGFNLADLSSVTDPMGRSSFYSADSVGRIDSVTDAASNFTKLSYDKKDRVVSMVDALNQTTALGYDANGNTKSVLLPGHTNPHTFEYDSRNRTSSQKDPLGRARTASYDGNGGPQTAFDAKNQKTSFTFDPFDRPQQITFADNSSIKYSFDNGNRLTSVVDSVAGTMGIAYDDYDHPTQVTTTYGAVNYQFDAMGRMQWIQYPSGTRITYIYNNANQPQTMTVGSGTPFQTVFDDDGRLASMTLPNAAVRAHGYNAAGQITNIAYASGSTALGDWAFDYDNAGRLTTLSGGLVNPVAPLATQTSTFDDANQISTLNGSAVSLDNNGSQLTGDANQSFGYDVRGRLTTATSGGLAANYTLNSFGLRDTKIYNGVTTHYLYDLAGHLVVETDATNKTLREYVWLGDTPVMVRIFATPGTASTATEYYIWSDHLNTPRVITDTSNNMVWRWDSDAYGNGAANGNPRNIGGANFVFNLRFPGQYFDAETGLHYNAARDYNPKTGRYVQSDPIGLSGGLNTYQYVEGDPISLVDPTGEFGIPGAVAGGIIGGISGGLGAAATGGNVWRGAFFGAASGAFVGGTGAWIGASILGQSALRAATGAVANTLGQMQGIGDPCFTGVNAGAIAGSALGGALGGVLSPGAWGTKFVGSLASQVAQRSVAGLPGSGLSAAVGLAGNRIGASEAKCGCTK